MGRTAAVVYCLILTGGTVAAQAAKEERALPQWLTGLIAVVGFLFLVFVAFLVNKAWCGSSKERTVHAVKMEDWAETNGASNDTSLDMVRSKDHDSAYENLSVDGGAGDKVTAM